LKYDVFDKLLAPTLKRFCRVLKLGVKHSTRVSMVHMLLPPGFDNIEITKDFRPNRFKHEPLVRGVGDVGVEEQW
jgi:hypothetical protein